MKQTPQRRDEIKMKTWELFSHFGYKGTTIEQIARACRMGKGTFYNYFKTKEDILKDMVRDSIIGLNHDIDQAMSDESLPAREVVVRAVETYFSFREGQLLILKLEMEAQIAQTDEVVAIVEAQYDATIDAIERVIGVLTQRNLIRPPSNGRLAAFVIVNTWNSLLRDWTKSQASLPFDEVKAVMEGVIFDGLIQEK